VRRKCRFPNCDTLISLLNKDEGKPSKFCFKHRRVLEQNHIEYSRNQFYTRYYLDSNKIREKRKVFAPELLTLKDVICA
jgi:hypothetical protein